jgi:hypothetical protein
VRTRLAALIAGVAVIAGCHSEPTAPDGRDAAKDAAQVMLHLADSLSAYGGNPNEVSAYRGLASMLAGTGRLSTVTISVDGVASEYLATAQELAWGCPQQALCSLVAIPPMRSMVAWDKANPRRMVQLFTSAIPTFSRAEAGMNTPPELLPSLLFLDGNGAIYGGDATSQSMEATVSDTPCATRGDITTNEGVWPCKQAEFTAAFTGTVKLIPLEGLYADYATTMSRPSSTPQHQLAMSSQRVHGARVDLLGVCRDCPTPTTTPPVSTPWRDSLQATLTTTLGSDVTFTFTVTNTGAQPAEVRFNDGQQYDIRVWNASNVLVWRWGADKAFTQALATRTLAPGESVSYVEHWKPTSAGSYHAMAYLTSSSHGAVAFANFQAP